MSSRLIAGIVAGICGTFFLGYCIYFDKKRRSDPHYKQKLLERRRQAKLAQKEEDTKNRAPDKTDAAAVQQYFMEEVQQGEELLTHGEYEQAVKHLTNAVLVCGQPQQLLQLFQNTLPPNVFQMLVENLNGLPTAMKEKSEEGDSLD